MQDEKSERAQAEEDNQQKNELKERVRQHQMRFAEERKHTNIENIGDAALWPLEFNPRKKDQDEDEDCYSHIEPDDSASRLNRFNRSDMEDL